MPDAQNTASTNVTITADRVPLLDEVLNAAVCVARLPSTDDDWECVRASELSRLRRAVDAWKERR